MPAAPVCSNCKFRALAWRDRRAQRIHLAITNDGGIYVRNIHKYVYVISIYRLTYPVGTIGRGV
jgi:hypothetical protein